MSRHRYVRNIDLDEAYEDAYDDSVYGRSVDDDNIVSPSSQQYMYSHARGRYDSYTPADDEIIEEDDDASLEPAPYVKPQLSDEDECRLLSVLDQLRNVLGESATDAEMTSAVLAANYSVEGSLDALLNTTQQSTTASLRRSAANTQKASAVPAGSAAQAIAPSKKTKAKKGTATATAGPSANTSKKTGKTNTDGRDGGATKVTASAVRVMRGFQVQPSTDGHGSRDSSASPDEDQPPPPTKQPKPARMPTRQRDKAVDVSSAFSAMCGGAGGKELINLVVVGHVDAGKSTLTGHLLYNQGNVSKRVMHKYEQESKKTGKQSAFAWVMDDTEEERTRGVTVDVAERSFETKNKLVNILDAPGHRDFIPNMISGAARADVALLVVDASTGEFEAGFENSGQTREHAMLIKSLGVSQLSVAINKLDTMEWAKDRYDEISTALTAFLKTVGYRASDVTYVPCSGLTGENLTGPPTEKQLTQWYTGPTILQAIDAMKSPEREVLLPTRFSVGDVFKAASSNMCVSGKLHTGYVRPQDKLVLMPHMVAITVKDVTSGSGTSGELFAGDGGTLTVSGAEPEELTIGSFLCDPACLMKQVTALQARIVVFNVLVPIIRGAQVEFHHQALCEPANVRRLVSQINKTTGEVVKKSPRVLARQSAGVVEIELVRPVCLETYKDNKELGRFMLRQQGATVAAGLVTEILGCRVAAPEGSGLL